MDNKEKRMHEAIREKFRFARGEDNLPYLGTADPRGSGRHRIAELIGEFGYKEGVEVGVRRGGSALAWLRPNPDLHLTCIDPWSARKRWGQAKQDEFYRLAIENLTPYNVDILKMTSMEALSKFVDGSLDFVHIDGNHEFDYCCPDIIFWSQKLRKGGMIAIHDYIHFHRAGVIKAVDAYTHTHHIDPWYVTRDRLPSAFWIKP